MRDNYGITSHPHSDRSLYNGESALQKMVSPGVGAEELKQEGFGDEAVEFALEKREKTKEQLERDGWDEVAAQFLLKHQGRSREQLLADGLSQDDIKILEHHRPLLAESSKEVQKWHGNQQQFEEAEAAAASQTSRTRTSFQSHIQSQLHSHLLRQGFDTSTLRHFAGSQRYVSARELATDGIEIEAMGLTVPNQTFNPPLPEYSDPWDLETEGLVTQSNRASRRLWLGLKYWEGMPVLRKARMLSKPTKRISLTTRELGHLVRGNRAGEVKPLTRVGEIVVVRTEKLGVLEVRECVERRVGGMVLCRIW